MSASGQKVKVRYPSRAEIAGRPTNGRFWEALMAILMTVLGRELSLRSSTDLGGFLSVCFWMANASKRKLSNCIVADLP